MNLSSLLLRSMPIGNYSAVSELLSASSLAHTSEGQRNNVCEITAPGRVCATHHPTPHRKATSEQQAMRSQLVEYLPLWVRRRTPVMNSDKIPMPSGLRHVHPRWEKTRLVGAPL